MRLLTWLPRELRTQLLALDPASKARPGGPLSVDDVLARAEEGAVSALGGASTVTPRVGRKSRLWAVLASVAALVLIAAVGMLAVSRTSPSRVASGESTGPSTDPTATVSAGSSTQAAAKLWSSFPVAVDPRPVVLVGQGVELPSGAFPNGDTKLAFLEGRVHLAVPPPLSPASRDGYPIISATDAITAMTAPVSPGPVGGTPITTTLQVSSIALTDRAFLTDRGEQSLPAWQIHLDGIAGDAYVLAVSSSARFAVDASGGGDQRPASVSADGTQVTIPFIPHQDPARCESGFTNTLQIAQTSTAIVLATTTTTDLPPTPSTPSPSYEPARYLCDGGDLVLHVAALPHQPLVPGEPGTRTITLDQPLGARAVVDAQGRPYVVVSAK